MSARPLSIPEETRANQSIAADPENSAWVSANAGSGKTYVLSRRVVRLLLGGADPASILCLTYTKAAAANMAIKIFDELSRWTVLPDHELAQTIHELEGQPPGQEKLRLARRLFARALETPGGLKIQTIHAFCEAILHQFPLEANIAGHFELLDPRMETALVGEAREAMLAAISKGDNPQLSAAFQTVLSFAGEFGFENLITEIVAKREILKPILERHELLGGAEIALRNDLGVPVTEDELSIMSSVWPDRYFTESRLRALLSSAGQSSKKRAGAFAEGLLQAMEITDVSQRFSKLRSHFLKRENNVWKRASCTHIAAKDIVVDFPELSDEFNRCADSLVEACDRLATLEMIRATTAACQIAGWLIDQYQRLKSARGYLDFNDLISKTADLLSRPDAGPWVQYKLDSGLDHILIDEAQDTSPGQWQVIRKLAEDFFSGSSARDNARRTIFAVGDEKQSIYSFQGAEPAGFAETGREFHARVTSARRAFHPLRLRHSFRSVNDVLSAVDLVFKTETARHGLTLFPEDIYHPAIREHDPGYVEVWPMIGGDRLVEPEDWTEAVDHASAPSVRLAELVSARIKDWLREENTITGKRRRLSPGDIMVLVRKRDSFVHALSRSLKNRNVPVAGADRLKLADHIAIKDLIAIGRFALQPDDDLSLAALLRSPVFALTDAELYDLAHERGPTVSLWSELKKAESKKLQSVTASLSRWRNEAGYKPVPEFYGAILGRDRVRAAMIARLGGETGEVLDEFMNFALANERSAQPGLGAFLQTLEQISPEIKRQIDQTRDEVRIMTVHAAKGLEAPVVFLVDNGTAPSPPNHMPRLMIYTLEDGFAAQKRFVWRASARFRNRFMVELERRVHEKADQEYRRLLYVGMTRAEDRLIICGYHGVQTPKPEIWHCMVSRALADHGTRFKLPESIFGGEGIRYEITPKTDTEQLADQPPPPAEKRNFPTELYDPLPVEIYPRPLAPSGAVSMVEAEPEPLRSRQSPVLAEDDENLNFGISRGIAIHRLLQVLPDMKPESRVQSAMRYLQRFGAAWPQDERDRAQQSVEKILSDKQFGELFGQNSRPEVSLTGRLSVGGVERAVSGKIDRLAIIENKVLFVDFKTGRQLPSSLAEIPDAYIAQVAIYRKLLQRIYPGKAVTAGILFTEAPKLFEIPDKMMQSALERLTIS